MQIAWRGPLPVVRYSVPVVPPLRAPCTQARLAPWLSRARAARAAPVMLSAAAAAQPRLSAAASCRPAALRRPALLRGAPASKRGCVAGVRASQASTVRYPNPTASLSADAERSACSYPAPSQASTGLPDNVVVLRAPPGGSDLYLLGAVRCSALAARDVETGMLPHTCHARTLG